MELFIRKPSRPTSARDAQQRLDAINAVAEAAGVNLGPAFAEARGKLDRTREIIDELRRRRENPDQAVKRIARQLVRGELDLDAAAAQAVQIEATVAGGRLSRAVGATDAIATAEAFADAGHAINGQAILAECRAIVAQAVEDVRALRKTIGQIGSDSQATRAGAKVAAAWADYHEVLARWDGAHDLVLLLRDEHWVDPLPTRDAPRPGHPGPPGRSPKRRYGRRYARPDLLADARRAAKEAGREFLELLDERCDVAEPGGPYTVEEERAYLVAMEEVHQASIAASGAALAQFTTRQEVKAAR